MASHKGLSILGPLLFLIYINDFNRTLSAGKCIMFADDTNIFFSSNSYDSLYKVANSKMVKIDNWLIANKLALNVNKTKHTVLRTPNSKLPPPGLKILLRNKHVE